MKKLKIFKILTITILFTILFILTFHLPFRSWIPIYTYYGLCSLIILTIILIILLYIIKKFFSFDIKDCMITILLSFSINIFFFCMVPVTIERSISVFMLNEMNEKDFYTKKEIENLFIEKYVYEYGAFDKRFKEQIATGTISKTNSKYYLNKNGKKLLKKFKFIKNIYNIKTPILK